MIDHTTYPDRLRELADLTGEPMLTPDQTEALVRERDTARAEADALRAEVDRLRPLRALCERAQTSRTTIDLIYHPDADPMRDGSGWLCEVDDWSTHAGPLDTVIAAACDRLGVDHG